MDDRPPADAGWRQVQLAQRVRFSIPPSLDPVPVQSIDSFMALYRSERCELVLDYGRYADPLDLEEQPAVDEWTRIDGRRARILSFTDGHRRDGLMAVTAVHFPETGDGPMRLTMRFSCRTDHDREAGRRIFESVNFVAASPDA